MPGRGPWEPPGGSWPGDYRGWIVAKKEHEDTFTTASGVVLRLRVPNREAVLAVDRAWMARKPQAPQRTAETAFGPEKVPDYKDADYATAVQLWSMEYATARFDFMAASYVEVEPEDKVLAGIAATYAVMREVAGVPPPYDLATETGRKLAYIHGVLANDEVARLHARLMALASPTEEEVAEAEAGFRGAVDGPAGNG